MTATELAIPGLFLFDIKVFRDARGYFFESFRQDIFEKYVSAEFVQENQSLSSRGVIRGLHFQRGDKVQGKLVRVIDGAIYDVVVDLRSGSPFYGKHLRIPLSSEKPQALWVPRGFAHGLSILSETAVFSYKCDNYYAPEAEGGLVWNDPALGIDWGIDNPVISEKDAKLPLLKDLSGTGF